MAEQLLLPMLVHVSMVALLYALLTVVRAPKVWNLWANADGSNPFAKFEPKVSANLTNQFEWPVLFYVVCIIVIARPELYQPNYLWLSWLFIFGRIIHSATQIFTANIRLRGAIFTINFTAVIGMWFILGSHVFIK